MKYRLRFLAGVLVISLAFGGATATAAETAGSQDIARLIDIITQLQAEVTALQQELSEASSDGPEEAPRSHRKPPGFNHYSASSRLAEPNRATNSYYGPVPFYGPDYGYPSGYRAPGFWFGGYRFGFYPGYRHGRADRQRQPPPRGE